MSTSLVYASSQQTPFATNKHPLQTYCWLAKPTSAHEIEIKKERHFSQLKRNERLKAGKYYYGKILVPVALIANEPFVLKIGEADSVRIHLPTAYGMFQAYLTGRCVSPEKNAEVVHLSQGIALPNTLYAEAGFYTIYFSAYAKRNICIDPHIYKPRAFVNEFYNKQTKKRLLIGLYLGSLVVIFILSVVFFVVWRNRLYLRYALYIFLHGVFTLCVFNSELLSFYAYPNALFLLVELLGSLQWIAYLNFILSFVNNPNRFRFSFRLIRLLRWGLLGLMLLSIYASLADYTNMYLSVRNYFLLVFFVANAVIFVYFLVSNKIYARIAGLGGLALSLAWGVFFGLSLLGQAKVLYVFQLGQLFEIAVFTTGLAFRMYQHIKRKRRAQEKLLSELKKNQLFQQEAAINLEQKVKARTNDLQAANDEIMAQRDQIEKQNQEIVAQHNLLEEQINLFLDQYNDVSASIHYTRRLQMAMLPSQESIDKLLPKNFIFHLPQNIVSGDFYWVGQVHHYTIIVAGDCTGHGVPGAFISLLGIYALNEIILRKEFTSPGLILDEMRDRIINSISKRVNEQESSDGIDMAICVIDPVNTLLEFAGAFNPLIVIRDRKIIELKGDRMPVGLYDKLEPFTTHTLAYQPGDRLYLYSDGFADQIGGPNDKKFKTKYFKQLLLEVHLKPMAEQRELLYQTYMNWKQNAEQIDDILILGIEL